MNNALSTLAIFIALSYTSAQNFSTLPSDSIVTILNTKTPNLTTKLRAIGETNRTELIEPIYNFLRANDKLSSQTKWSAYLTLARLGDTSATDFVIQRVRKFGVNDDVVYDLFPDLVYTRQKEAFSYLIEIIHRDEKNCESADAENNQKINCAFRVLEMVAPHLKNFPIQVDPSGDLKIRDYDEALAIARNWLSGNSNFEISK